MVPFYVEGMFAMHLKLRSNVCLHRYELFGVLDSPKILNITTVFSPFFLERADWQNASGGEAKAARFVSFMCRYCFFLEIL